MPDGLFPVLAFDKSLIGQLVFVLIAVLAWILREAAERRAAERAEEGPQEGAREPSALERIAALLNPEDAEQDAVQARVEARLRARRAEHPEAYVGEAAASEAEAAAPPPVPAGADPGRPIGGLQPTFVPKDLGTMASHPDMATTRRGGGASIHRRLGIAPGAGRAAVRRAVLWSEVLGPPRAVTGPHRPPMARR